MDEGLAQGARLGKICEVIGISSRTCLNWRRSQADLRTKEQRKDRRPCQPNRLSEQEIEVIIKRLCQPDTVDLSIEQAYHYLLDQGIHLASISTLYRIARKRGLNARRDATRAPAHHAKPKAYVAKRPNQVWSWDITYFKDSRYTGRFFYAYVIVDIFSRYVIRAEVHEADNAEYASEFLKAAIRDQGYPKHLVLHSDNGSSMRAAKTMAVLAANAVTFSHSRPHVSNDNPYSESLFRTLKYCGDWRYPRNGFSSLEAATAWLGKFVEHYNEKHYHRSIQSVTPGSRFRGEDAAILERRMRVLEQAREQTPRRWIRGRIRCFAPVECVVLNPDKAPPMSAGTKPKAAVHSPSPSEDMGCGQVPGGTQPAATERTYN